MRAALLVLPLVAGCDYLFGLDHVVPADADPATIDAFVGTVIDAADCGAPAQPFFGRNGANGAGLSGGGGGGGHGWIRVYSKNPPMMPTVSPPWVAC